MHEQIDIKYLDLPQDLNKFSYDELDFLALQIRNILIKTVLKTGGHLSSNLGTVELSIAIHRVFDSPNDKLVWDVGHQSYAHKILTGRLDELTTLRQKGGISGFCRPDESEHDAFISGHSSVSVSAALGIATAMKLNNDNHHAVAIIGDGAFTGGEAFEGLNNAGKSKTNLIIILNHNEMSISKNVGGFAKYLTTFRTKDSYKKTKSVVERVLDKTPLLGKPLKKTLKASKNTVKNMIINTTMFEDLGFEFVGPLDGHNIVEIEEGLKAAKALNRPVVVQVNTIKGKGYKPAEENPGQYHGVPSFELQADNPDISAEDSFSAHLGKELSRLADSNDKICAITAAMKYGTGLNHFCKNHKDRFFDVGIAEQHAVTFAAGLATKGMIPVFAVYSSFLQRGYDQILHDLAITKAHVILSIDRSGIVGQDGVTHQGIFDVPFLRTIPGIKIYSPSDYDDLSLCLEKATNIDEGIVAIRYPKGSEDRSISYKKNGRTNYQFFNNKSKTLIISYGRLFNESYKAMEKLDNKVDLLKLIEISDITDDLIEKINSYKYIYSFEECYKIGSLSLALKSVVPNLKFRTINSFVEQNTVSDSLDELGLSCDKICETINLGKK